MNMRSALRRRLVLAVGATMAGATAGASPHASAQSLSPTTRPMTLFSFGDSILDCGRYNDRGVHPAALLVRNDDALFPEFRGRDLASRGLAVRLEHRAVDGATSADLRRQAEGIRRPAAPAVALVTVGGNDLLRGLAADRTGAGLRAFEATVRGFAEALPVRPILFGTVYDPTFGDDARNFTGIEPRLARANLMRVNAILGDLAARHGQLADLHAHFLRGDPSWFTRTIEPSLVGASEVRRVFLSLL
jgi:lysophospholipase L1-like esterase